MMPHPHKKETIKFLPTTGIHGAEILSVRNSSRLWKTYHETYTICTNIPSASAYAEWTYRKHCHSAAPGDLLIMEPGELHATKKQNGRASFDVLFISPQVVNELSQSLGMGTNPHLRTARISKENLFSIFLRFLRSSHEAEPSLMQETLFLQAISSLLAVCAEKNPHYMDIGPTAQLMRAQEFIHAFWNRKVSLTELAKVSGLDKFHFLRSFSRQFGLPPHAYQTQLRISRARTLLKKGGIPSHLDLGFSDQSHLIRHFKQALGVTPGRYASMMNPSNHQGSPLQ